MALIAALGIIISLWNNSSEPISGKAFANLSSSQKQLYWKCMADNKCNVLLKEAQVSKDYTAYRKCAKDCSDLASNIKPESYYCTDSDGKDFLTKSKVVSNLYPQGKEDYCFTFPSGKTYLMEGICKDNKYAYVQKNCGEMGNYECKEGKCVLQKFCLNNQCQNKQLDLIIITRPLFIDSLSAFLDWKFDNNYKVGVFTLEHINAVNSNPDLNSPQCLKSFIHKIKSESGAKYFILVGDTKVNDFSSNLSEIFSFDAPWNLPTGYYYRKSGPIDSSTIELEYTDVYYADADLLGELPEQPKEIYSILDFEAYIARWPVRNPSEVTIITEKLKTFSETKKIDSFEYYRGAIHPSDIYLQILTYCVNTFANAEINGSGYLPSLEDLSKFPNEIASGAFDDCYNHPDIVFSLLIEPRDKDNVLKWVNYPGMSDSYDQAKLIKNEILSSPSSIIEHFHGSHDAIGLGGMEDPMICGKAGSVCLFSSELQFTNIFPLFNLNSCLTGTFYLGDDDSLNEALFKNNKGPLAIVFPMNLYLFYSQLFEGKTIGEAFYGEGNKMYTYTSVGNDLFTDPTLTFYS